MPDPLGEQDDDAGEGPFDEDGVESWFNTTAYEWWRDPLGDGNSLLIMEDEAGALIGAAAHHGTVAPYGRFIVAVAIATTYQNAGRGLELLAATFAHCRERAPGGTATWLVRRSNEPSIAMCAKVAGFNRELEPGERGEMWRYSFPL